MITLRFFLMMLTVFFISCEPNSVTYNHLNFRDDIQLVEKHMLKVKSYMELLPRRNSNKNVNYYFKNGRLFINDEEIYIDNINHAKNLSFLDEEEKEDFVDSIFFLTKNDIVMCYRDNVTHDWLFGYKSIGNEDYADVRLLSLSESKSDKAVNQYYNILDRKGRVILVSLK